MIEIPVVVAEVTFDGTVGEAKSITLDDSAYQIEATDGRQVGSNLYHSFKTFDIDPGETANFIGPASVSHVIGRVTGGAESTIAGTITSDIPGVNLWLFNPSGIVFKNGASVDIGGSFHVATADFIGVESGVKFGALTTENPVLTISEPETFGFVEDFSDSVIASKTISFQDASIDISSGDFTAVGSRVVLQNTNINVPNGTINVAAVREIGEAHMNNGRLDVTEFDQLGEVVEDNSTLTAKTAEDVNVSKFIEPVVAIREGVILLEYLPDQSLNEEISQLDIAKISTNSAVVDQPCEQLVANTFSLNFIIEKQGDDEEIFLVSQREAGITTDVSSEVGCQ